MAFDPKPHSTLRKIATEGATITVHCSQCGHSARLPMTAVALRIGWDTELEGQSLTTFLRCSKCGLSGKRRHPSGHRLSLTFSPNASGMGKP